MLQEVCRRDDYNVSQQLQERGDISSDAAPPRLNWYRLLRLLSAGTLAAREPQPAGVNRGRGKQGWEGRGSEGVVLVRIVGRIKEPANLTLDGVFCFTVRPDPYP